MEISKFHKVVRELYEQILKPPNKAPLGQLYSELSNLSPEQRGEDHESIQDVIRALCDLGINQENYALAHEKDLNPAEWMQLKEALEPYIIPDDPMPPKPSELSPESKSIKKFTHDHMSDSIRRARESVVSEGTMGDLSSTSSESLVILNFIHEVRQTEDLDTINTIVKNYIAIVGTMAEPQAEKGIASNLQPVLKILEECGWKWSGFDVTKFNKKHLLDELMLLAVKLDEDDFDLPPRSPIRRIRVGGSKKKQSPPILGEPRASGFRSEDMDDLDDDDLWDYRGDLEDELSPVVTKLQEDLVGGDIKAAITHYLNNMDLGDLDPRADAVNDLLFDYDCFQNEDGNAVIDDDVDWEKLKTDLVFILGEKGSKEVNIEERSASEKM